MGSELKDKTAKGIGWGFIDNLSNTGIMAVVNIILANILLPEQFGIVAMSTIFITLANSLVDSGFTGALTRKLEVTAKDFNTVFVMMFLPHWWKLYPAKDSVCMLKKIFLMYFLHFFYAHFWTNIKHFHITPSFSCLKPVLLYN